MEVSRSLNISRAAERIGISQPTLTQSIRKLEAAVGAQLLIRTRAGVRLTKPGQRISGQVLTLLESWAGLQKEAQQDEHEIQRKFRVGIHPSFKDQLFLAYRKDVMTSRSSKTLIEIGKDCF